MDWKQNKFLIIVIGIIVVELGVYFWFSSSYSSKIQQALEEIESAASDVNSVKNIRDKSQLVNKKWVQFYKQKKQKLATELKQCIDFYTKRDEPFEKLFEGLTERASQTDYWLRYDSKWKELIQSMEKAGITFDRDEETDKFRGFDRFKEAPPTPEMREKAQKGYWIHEALVQAMIRHGATRFYSSKITFNRTVVSFKPGSAYKFTPPFHIIQVEFIFSIPFHQFYSFLRDILNHPYLNFNVRKMSLAKDKFEYVYKTMTASGSWRTFRSGEMSYFDRAYFHIRLPEAEFDKFRGAALEKVFFPPSVQVNLLLEVWDFDPKLVVPPEKLLSSGKAKRPRRRRRR